MILPLLQQFTPEATPDGMSEGTDWFFDFWLWILVVLPLVVIIVMAGIKKKKTPELPHTGDASWQEDVDESVLPVVLHVYSTWSIGDRVIEKQVQKLADETTGRLKILWCDIDKNPGVAQRYPTLEQRSVALFVDGDLLWQGTGVHGHEDILREIEEVIAGS